MITNQIQFNPKLPSSQNLIFQNNRNSIQRFVPQQNAFKQNNESQLIIIMSNQIPTNNNTAVEQKGLTRKMRIQEHLQSQNISIKLNKKNKTSITDNQKLDDLPNDGLLQKQIKFIEKEVLAHREIQKFMLSFSKNPEQAIKQVIQKGLIKDNPKSIAQYLIQFQAINKVALGQYFAKNKKNILQVLKEFCRLLNFKNLQFDKALRELLSKFKLPGEAQQIQRIMEIFANIYYESHPSSFTNSDQIFILSYSLIMLATDAHSPLQQRKMTKQQFTKNTSPVCPKIPRQYLEGMYDRIVKQPFQTQTNYLEKIYDRLNQLRINISHISQIVKVIDNNVELINGHIFIKYCKNRAKSVQRKIYLSKNQNRLLWQNPNKQGQKPRFIQLKDIIDLNLGCNSPVMKMNKVPKQFDSMCFSIVTNTRTLDLKAKDADHRAKWVNYLGALLIKKRQDLKTQRENYYKSIFNRQKIQEIWNNDIFPHWDNHWDYQLKRPKHKKYQNFFKAVRKFCQCVSKNTDEVYQVQEGQYQNVLPIKTPLLLTLWKYGLPQSSRKTLWPIVIGNELGITKKLYEIYNKKRKQLPNIHKMPYSNEAINLVELLAVVRPDIQLIKNLLQMATIFLKYLNEYDSFCALANLMHHYHFLAFYQGQKQEIEFRINFFDYLLTKNQKLVHQHLIGLELNPKLYLINWFLSIFCTCFQQKFLARIWDNFFLEGQLYLFKVGVTIIKYYGIELKMSTFDQSIKILSHPKNPSQVLFFQILDDINVNQQQFQDFIKKRKYAVIKTKVQQIPLE